MVRRLCPATKDGKGNIQLLQRDARSAAAQRGRGITMENIGLIGASEMPAQEVTV
jgi:hypothetical protein